MSDDNSPKPKCDPLLAEKQKKLFSRFPLATKADLRRIGLVSNNDVVFSIRPSVLQAPAHNRQAANKRMETRGKQ